jgi:DNA-binding NarL/FixJ family response regulator
MHSECCQYYLRQVGGRDKLILCRVITPSPYMASRIQQSLRENGDYKVIICNSPSDILELAEKSTFYCCILDIFHPDFPVLSVLQELKTKQPELRLILILSRHGLTKQDIQGIKPDGYLPRSFNPSQLQYTLSQIQKKVETETLSDSLPDLATPSISKEEPIVNRESPDPTSFTITQDVANLTNRLSTIKIETTAQAVIIIRRKQLIAHLGVLPSSAIQETVELINNFSKTSAQYLQKIMIQVEQSSGNWDVIRTVQLESIPGKYLLYIISLSKEMLLAMLFDMDTPFNAVRRQTILVAHKLLEPWQGNKVEYSPSYNEFTEQSPSQSTKPDQHEWILEFPKNQLTPEPPTIELETPPNEGGEIISPGSVAPGTGDDAIITQYSPDILARGTTIEDTSKVAPNSEQVDQTDYHDVTELDDQLSGEPLETESAFAQQNELPVCGYESVSAFAGKSSGYYITYSCLLIPRMPEHLLTSNLASYLFKWMGQVCLAYGWRLEHLSIHPDYIQMITEAPLTISPAYLTSKNFPIYIYSISSTNKRKSFR